MAKVLAKFKAIPVNPEVDPSGGCRMQLTDRQIYDEATVFDEVVDSERLPFTAEMLEFAFKCVLRTVAKKIATDCNARKIGNYIQFVPRLHGKIDGPYSAFGTGKNNGTHITARILSGIPSTIDMDKVTFVNEHTGTRVRLDRISWIGADDGNVLKVGEPFAAYGTNMQYVAALGDSAVMEWEDGSGTMQSQALTCTESDYNHMRFAWPERAPEAGAEAKIVITSRAGIDGNYAQVNSKVVSIVAP